MQNVSEFEKSSIRKNWQQDSANDLSRGSLTNALATVKKQGGLTGLLITSREKLLEQELKNTHDVVLIIDNVPHDSLGFAETILISNGSMILMNKVHGNQMIDVRASNKKLIDHSIRLVKGIWSEYQTDCTLSDEALYHYVAHVSTIKKSYKKRCLYPFC